MKVQLCIVRPVFYCVVKPRRLGLGLWNYIAALLHFKHVPIAND